jgi:phosphatidylethanolamine/phosphatidyl-N-methylethanolamine N-methyltransferase
MDAHQMTFEDATFDCVVAQFVITLVANPEQVLSECHRVVKPGGRIILVNHLYSEVGVAAAVERWAAKKTRALTCVRNFHSAAAGMGAIKCRDDPR